jgi:hypothetical protein
MKAATDKKHTAKLKDLKGKRASDMECVGDYYHTLHKDWIFSASTLELLVYLQTGKIKILTPMKQEISYKRKQGIYPSFKTLFSFP